MGLRPCLFRRAKELRAYRHLPPSPTPPLLFALALAHTAPEGPSYQESQSLSYRCGGWWPGWVLRSQEILAQLPAQVARLPCKLTTVALWASVSPQEAQVPPRLGWLLTTAWRVCDQLGGWASVAPGGPACPLQAKRGPNHQA